MKPAATVVAALLIAGAASAQDAPNDPTKESEKPQVTVRRSFTVTAPGRTSAHAKLIALEVQISEANSQFEQTAKMYRPESRQYVEAKAKLASLLNARAVALSDLAAANAGIEFHPFAFNGFGSDVKVDLDLDDATPRDAFKQLFERAKLDGKVDDDVADKPRITVHAHGVRLSTAVELIGQGQGLAIIRQRDGSVRVGKASKLPNVFRTNPNVLQYITPSQLGTSGLGGGLGNLGGFSSSTGEPLSAGLSRYFIQEERSSFTCPHCKGQVTVIRKRQQPQCPKCNRTFQSDWQFCPFDGAKRPATTGEWRYCPLCGKEVEMKRSGTSVPFVGDLPIIGRLFRTEPQPGPEAEPEPQPLPDPLPCLGWQRLRVPLLLHLRSHPELSPSVPALRLPLEAPAAPAGISTI